MGPYAPLMMITAFELPHVDIDIDEIESLIQMDGDVEVKMTDGETFKIVGTTLRTFIHCLFEPQAEHLAGPR